MTFGMLANPAQLAAVAAGAMGETDASVKAKLTVLSSLISVKPGDFVKAIQNFSPTAIDPPASKPVAPATPPAGGETPPVVDPKK